ncbi:MAG: SLBB domain-containing protein [Terriglobales bacterium]
MGQNTLSGNSKSQDSGASRVNQVVSDEVGQTLKSPVPESSAPLEQAPGKIPEGLPKQELQQITQQPKTDKVETAPATKQVPVEVRKNGRPNPYQNVPALFDLYTQVSADSPNLQRFGTQIFRNGTGNIENLPMDLPVGPDYILGPGDGLNIDVWGSVSDRLQRVVDRQGEVTLPEVGSINAAGQSLAEVQRALESLLRSRFRNVQVAVSLTRVRTVRVYVVGDVERAGAYDISSLSTPLNALYVAGGPTDRGSLRTVRHYRGQQLVQEVDLYDLLLRGVRGTMERLQPGDTILVPPAGPEVTVQGMVRRPAIYELRQERSLAEVLALAGGVLPTGTLRHVEVERVESHQKRTMLSLDLPEQADDSAADRLVQEFQLQDRDVVRIAPILPYSDKTVFLDGHVVHPGKHSYREGMTVADLIRSSSDLLPEPAVHAEVIRLVPPEYRPVVLTFSVSPREGKVDPVPLKPFDTVRIFSRYDFEDFPFVSVKGEVRNPGDHRINGELHVRDAVYLAGGLTNDALLSQAQIYRKLPDSNIQVFTVNLGEAMAGEPTANIALQPTDSLVIHANVAKINPPRVFIFGEVASPGQYPLSDGMRVSDLVRMAGGFTRGAYREQADLGRYTIKDGQRMIGEQRSVAIAKALNGDADADIVLQDGDVLSIRQVMGWNDIGAAVSVGGEVAHPGRYGILPHERLSSVLRRAGGFRDTAYPAGIILERGQVRDLAQKARQELVQRIETATMTHAQFTPGTIPKDQAEITEMMASQRQQMLARLKEAPVSGRIALNITGNIDDWAGTPADIELNAGDTIVVPKEPHFVLVTGEVYGPTAIAYTPGKTVSWYLNRAGGVTQYANKSGIFVVRASGIVIGRNSGGFWSDGVLGRKVQAGDAIIVPEKIVGPSLTWRKLIDSAQVLSSIAIAAKAVSSF